MTSHPENVIITGFMATGKSTVGRRVAAMLRRPFVDMDAVIVERAGMPIPEIFRREGEGRFRELEAQLCRELGKETNLVVATGGGAMVSEANRRALADRGLAICLGCRFDALLERLGSGISRPMLSGDDLSRRTRELLVERQSAYREIPFHIETADKTPDQVAVEVVALASGGARACWVRGGDHAYPVLVGAGLHRHLGALLAVRGYSAKVAVVTNDTVGPLYAGGLIDALVSSGFSPFEVRLPDGEAHKTLGNVAWLYDAFAENGLDRSGAVVALGGGVVTDMAGFAAATYMRGVSLVMVPTSLLAMVDASVGGKVAVDRPQGKNLVGAFYQPALVVAGTDTLATLPDVRRRSGLAEIIKAGIIADRELFAAYESGPAPDLAWAIERAIAVKIRVVERDPYERGERATLNLGHTFGHAIERLEAFRLDHGLAVSMGMVAAAHLGELMGLCSEKTRRRVEETLARHGLPVAYGGHSPADILDAMGTDKKRRGDRLRLVIPREIGRVSIEDDVPEAMILRALERIRP